MTDATIRPPWWVPLLVAAIIAVLPSVGTVVVAAGPDDGTAPPVTANEFLPEDAELTDCIGALERPGCGSESRGGWRQTVVFGLMGAGLVVVFGRVVIAARRGRDRDSAISPDGVADDDRALPSGE